MMRKYKLEVILIDREKDLYELKELRSEIIRSLKDLYLGVKDLKLDRIECIPKNK